MVRQTERQEHTLTGACAQSACPRGHPRPPSLPRELSLAAGGSGKHRSVQSQEVTDGTHCERSLDLQEKEVSGGAHCSMEGSRKKWVTHDILRR